MTTRNVLSDDEMDALMNTVAETSQASGDTEIHRAFDFASREHFAMTQMKSLSTVNERLCLQFKSRLTEAFSFPVDVALEKLEILKIDECMTALKDGAVLNVIKLNLASGKGLLVVDGELLSELINRYFGSHFSIAIRSNGRRVLSTTEARINDRLLELFGSALKIGWKDIADIEIEKVITETNPDFIKFGGKEELGVRFTLAISFFDFTGSIEWLLPYASIEPLSAGSTGSDKTNSDMASQSRWSQDLRENILDVHLDVQVVLSQFEMNLRDIKRLKVGTVLPLASPSEAQLCIENVPFFCTEYGAQSESKAIVIKTKIEL